MERFAPSGLVVGGFKTSMPGEKRPQLKKKTVTTVTATKRAPARPKAKRVVKQPSAPSVLVQKIPHCSVDYGNCLVNPFDTPGGVCVPYGWFAYNSQKVKAFVRGRFALGTTGFGYVLCRPVSCNDGVTLKVTQATSVGTGSTAIGAYTNVVDHNFTQLPFTTAQFTAGVVQARTVGIGIRAKYVGPLSSRNGTIVGFEEPDHASIQNVATYTFDSISAHQVSMMERVGGDEWDMSVCYSGPATDDDIDYQASTTPLGNSYFLIIAISGVAGDIYEFEMYEHLEYIGAVATGRTPSHTDFMNAPQIANAARAEAAYGPLQPEKAPSFWQRARENIAELIPKVITVGSALFNSVARDRTSIMSPMAPSGAAKLVDFAFGGRVPGNNPLAGAHTKALLQRRDAGQAPHHQRRNKVVLM